MSTHFSNGNNRGWFIISMAIIGYMYTCIVKYSNWRDKIYANCISIEIKGVTKTYPLATI